MIETAEQVSDDFPLFCFLEQGPRIRAPEIYPPGWLVSSLRAGV